MRRLKFTSEYKMTYRPTFLAYTNHKLTMCLLDTGAEVPTFRGDPELFNLWLLYMKGSSIVDTISVEGVCGNATAPLYNIPEFVLSDGYDSILFKDMKVALLPKKLPPCDLILPATMFLGMQYKIDMRYPAKSYVFIESSKDEVRMYRVKGKGVVVALTDEVVE